MSLVNGIPRLSYNDYHLAAIAGLFEHTLPEKLEEFKPPIHKIVDYVNAKSKGRCLSEDLKNPEEVEKMIVELNGIYISGGELVNLCNSRLMQAMIFNDGSNSGNRVYLYHAIGKATIQVFQEVENAKKNPEIRHWLGKFHETTISPLAVSKSKEFYESLPKKYGKYQLVERTKIGLSLQATVNCGWLKKANVENIKNKVECNAECTPNCLELTDEMAENYFVQKYLSLISAVDEYSQTDEDKLRYREIMKRSFCNGFAQYYKELATTR